MCGWVRNTVDRSKEEGGDGWRAVRRDIFGRARFADPRRDLLQETIARWPHTMREVAVVSPPVSFGSAVPQPPLPVVCSPVAEGARTEGRSRCWGGREAEGARKDEAKRKEAGGFVLSSRSGVSAV